MNIFRSKRTGLDDSFEVKELMEIIRREAKRPIIESRRMDKNVNLSLAEKWLKILHFKQNPFLDNCSLEEIFRQGNKIQKTLAKKTLENLNNRKLHWIFDNIFYYLGESDTLQKSDFILVFGGNRLLRIQHAVKLWKKQWAPLVVITGQRPIYGKQKKSEAEVFKNWAVRNGVTGTKIITEDKSITIADNVRRTLNLLDEKNIKYKKIILVITWYAQRRAKMMIEKYLPQNVRLIRSSAFFSINHRLSKNRWYKNEYGIKVIFNEFLKMRIHHFLITNGIV